MTSRPILARWAVAVAVLAAVLPSAAFGIAQRPAGTRAVRQAMPAQVPSGSQQVPGIVLVRFKDASSASVGRTLRSRGVSASALTGTPKHGFTAVRVPKGLTADSFAAQLSRDPNVAAAAPDFTRHVLAYAPPNDPAYNDPASWGRPGGITSAYGKSWWLRSTGVNAAAAWQHGFSDPAARNFPVRAPASMFKVAVLDTGFYMDHPDKGPNIVAGIDEFDHRTPGGQLATDTNVMPPAVDPGNGADIDIVSHGTCTAGEVAAATNNDAGVASVGYNAKVVVYKVMGIDTLFSYGNQVRIDDQALINAICDATDAGCKVISMSLGGSDDSTVMQDAITYAWARGVVILAATGNYADRPPPENQVMFPAADDDVVGVGSYGVDASGRFRSDFTNYVLNPPPAKQNGVDILAPGEMVWGLIQPGYQSQSDPSAPPGYDFSYGTSMATPAAAGALAHLWRYQPSFSNQQIIDYLEHHAAPEGTNPNIGYGWGYLDMSLVMDGLMSDYPYLHAPALTTPATVPVGPNFITWNAVTDHSVVYNVSVDGSLVATSAGTWAGVTLTQGLHTYAVQATSLFDWYDGSSMSTGTIFADPTATATPTVVRRVAGYNRYDTAIQISRAHFATGTADTVVVATGENFPDALSAAALAGSYSAPLLLTPTNTLWRGIPGEISRLGARDAIIVGGPAGVSDGVRTQLEQLGVSVSRFQGADRYATSAVIAAEVKRHELELGNAFANEAFLARGDAFPDALAASPLAFARRIPILLVKPTEIPPVIWTQIVTLMPNVSTAHLVVAGSSGAIGTVVTTRLFTSLRAFDRVWGPTRYDTAAAMAKYGVKRGWATWRFVGVATGDNFPDALGGGVASGASGGVILLTKTNAAVSGCVDTLSSEAPCVDLLEVFGGASAVSAPVYTKIQRIF